MCDLTKVKYPEMGSRPGSPFGLDDKDPWTSWMFNFWGFTDSPHPSKQETTSLDTMQATSLLLTLSLLICFNRMSHWLPNSLPSHAWIHTLLHNSTHPFTVTFSKLVFHHEEFVGERYTQWNNCCSRNYLSYHTKINGIAYKMIGLSILFHKHREHFVHKCMAFHGYWKDWLVLCLISIIATCRLGYTMRKIRDQSFQPYIAWVWTAKKEKNTAVLKAGHDTPN